ncbi:hypothetical protein MES4922_30493 [Mesorhizobium ventifaucium]|uniref:Divalent metal cation transporter MntH n=1 Tax=Mesorhizobium ventifaucium TaxID=666020 RepID=A0ABN8JWL6_9HYPH|nr:hypothetical protein MES4922_30493 [Mesorhizobium ventifaucium]
MLLAYVAVLLVADVDPWLAAAKGLVIPSFPLNGDSFTVIVAILGTTISPYLLFWQSSQEVEEIEQGPQAKALVRAPDGAKREIRRIRLDTFVGMTVSNVVALAIMTSTAATLHAAERSRSRAPPTLPRHCARLQASSRSSSSALVSSEPVYCRFPFSPVPQPKHLGRPAGCVASSNRRLAPLGTAGFRLASVWRHLPV